MTDPEHTIAAVHALHLAELCERWAVTADALLAGLPLTPDDLSEPGRRLPIQVMVRLIERARELTGEPGLGVYMGMQMRATAHGHLGFAAMTAAKLGDALELTTRFAPTRTTALTVGLRIDGGVASVYIEERAAFGGARDALLLSMLIGLAQIGRALTGEALAGRLELAIPEPDYVGRFRALIPGPLAFDQPAHRLLFDSKLLELPLVLSDPEALRLAQEQCERELGQLNALRPLALRVRALLRPSEAPIPSLVQVAKALQTTPRTLKRRLSEEGATFTSIAQEARRSEALRLLEMGELTVEQVGYRVGYSEPGNFIRAFRRWTGRTPHAHRRQRSLKP